jgi:hypothetical protein
VTRGPHSYPRLARAGLRFLNRRTRSVSEVIENGHVSAHVRGSADGVTAIRSLAKVKKTACFRSIGIEHMTGTDTQ